MKVLVTGGSGFLGSAIVRQLVARGDEVVSLARKPSPELTAIGVRCIQGDIADAQAVSIASRGVDAVIHTAAKAGVWGDYQPYYQANVVGTRNVLAACRSNGVHVLVHTSSPSVVFTGEDQEGLDESAPYPKQFLAHYPRTKAEAERLVLAAADATLATVALRPHLIWGPGDNHLVPRLVQGAKDGTLKLVGPGTKLVDAVYIDNAVHAHIRALDRLTDPSTRPLLNGRVFFVTNHEPWPMGRIVRGILSAAGIAHKPRAVPVGAALLASGLMELAHKTLAPSREPRLTRFVARQLATAHWYDNSAAISALDYQPTVSMDEGLRRLAAHFGSSWSGAPA